MFLLMGLIPVFVFSLSFYQALLFFTDLSTKNLVAHQPPGIRRNLSAILHVDFFKIPKPSYVGLGIYFYR